MHQHHFHVEPDVGANNATWSALVTHGDDQCVTSAGGVACEIQQTPSGYAWPMPLPFRLSSDTNDVRANASEPFEWYILVAIKGRPHDGSLKYFTQIHMKMEPHPKQGGYFGTYYVPSNTTSMFWAEGTFLGSWDVLWSYYHSHSAWLKEMLFYVGANSTELQMEQTGVGMEVTEGMSLDQVAFARQQLSERAQALGAQLVCHFQRDPSQLEVYPGSGELSDHFYRKSAGCVPFTTARGMPYVAMVVTSPDSEAAALAKQDELHPDLNVALLHTVIRLFVHSDSYPWPSCNADCGYAPRFFVE